MGAARTVSTAPTKGRSLSPLDAAFLYFERPTQPLYVGCLAILDGAPPFDTFAETVGGRLARLERYRQVPVRPPLDWGLPTWRRDPLFDLRRHVHQVAVPGQGEGVRLARLVDDLLSSPLPTDRSPWDMTVIYGLAEGRTALVVRIHHCMIDGISGAQVLETIADRDQEPAPSPLPASVPERPGPWAAVRRAAQSFDLHTLAEVGSTLTSFIREPVSALPFNAPLSPIRKMVATSFPLADVLAARGALGCTVNDAVLAIITGALRRYLEARGVRVEGLRVRAGVPVSVRRDDDRLTLGNLVSAVFPHLPVDVGDPVERVRRIAHEMNTIKSRQQAQATGVLLGLLGSLPAPLEALVGRIMPDTAVVNTICTNVPGPRQRCALLGHPVIDVHPFVPLLQSMGLEFAIMSYADRLSISAAVDPALVPDAERLGDLLGASVAELRSAAAAATVRPPAVATSRPAVCEAVTVGALMSHPVRTLGPDDTLERAWAVMAEARIRHLPIVDAGRRLVGIVSHRDLIAVAPGLDGPEQVRHPLGRAAIMSIGEIMATHVVVTTPDELAGHAAERMVNGKIGGLPVLDPDGQVIGIITTEDVVRWATGRLVPRP